VTAVVHVAPVSELTGDRAAAARAQGRLAVRAQRRGRDVPGARGRVAAFGGAAGVGNAVPLVERGRAAVDGDRGSASHGRAQIEEVGVAAADALVLEVAVNDRQLEALAGARRAGLGVGAHLRRAGEARLFLALVVAAVALR